MLEQVHAALLPLGGRLHCKRCPQPLHALRPCCPPHPPPPLHAGPDFTKPVRVRYCFEMLQPMRVVIYDADTSASKPQDLKLADQDYIGVRWLGAGAGGSRGVSLGAGAGGSGGPGWYRQ